MLGLATRRATSRLARAAANHRNAHTVVLMRHGESTWNLENKFTGWHDVELSAKGHEEASEGGKQVAKEGIKFDLAYTSVLKRAIQTLDHALYETDQMWIPVIKAWQLNERHYGALQGLDKKETVAKHGKEQVNVWRRSYDVPPPELEASSEHYPGNDPRYALMDKACLPFTESLKITAERVVPYWQQHIVPDLKAGKTVLIAAHGNSLRALVQYLDDISNDAITGLNIPTATPLVYDLDADMKPIPHKDAIAPLKGRYLGDIDAIKARIAGVAAQTGK